jgi:acetyl/propionyl-CoA carboxylase alpha subunit
MGLSTVAVFTDADQDAPHVREADLAVHVSSYVDIEAILDAAHRSGADAVHPGYGFLSESADFARACAGRDITFVGPSAEAIEAMGSKIAAKELMAEAGVPILGSDGYPLLVKASFGGGGRGMRVVRDESELEGALAAAEREAASAFGDGTVFVERYVEDPRHIEVQIFGDASGNIVHLYERECSIQRRYQKVVEESPSPVVDDDLREQLGAAATAAGKALGYVGAGTVEFVLDRTGEFFFLEVNTRLQVEHPVTELVTGLDLVELQLRVAAGEALPEVPPMQGHAIEARLYAEDVAAGFVPVSGRIGRLDVPAGDGIRVDSGYESGSEVSTSYDAMLAKVIAGGDTRAEAIERLATCLERTQVRGVTTNRSLLVRVLRHPAFLAGETDTGFIARHGLTEEVIDHLALRRHAIAAALAGAAERRAAARVQPLVPSGWRNVVAAPQTATYLLDDDELTVRYRGLTAEGVDRVWSATPTEVDLTIDGLRHRARVDHHGAMVHVEDSLASSTLTEVDRFPLPGAAIAAGSLLAGLPGMVTSVLVSPGEAVTHGQPLLVLEAMKMEHTIASPSDGTVTDVLVEVGQQVVTGQVLAVVA